MLKEVQGLDLWRDWVRHRQHFARFDEESDALCRQISQELEAEGDTALLRWVQKLDGIRAESTEQLRLSHETCTKALKALEPRLEEALQASWERVQRFHEHELENTKAWSYEDDLGVRMGRQRIPVASAGVYVPGGKAPLFSSMVMNMAPAQVAGVSRKVVACPALPLPSLGHLGNEALAATAALTGADEVWCLGGALALIALAQGTETIEPVATLAGPGGRWVVAAKRYLYGRVGIDTLAGPSEVLVVADDSADSAWVAADLMAQAEHDERSAAVLITTSEDLGSAVRASLNELLAEHPDSPAHVSLRDHSLCLRVGSLEEALEAANLLAPEHLQLCVAEPEALVPLVRAAGAIMVGHHSAEVFGDYVAGPNHVLPTAGSAQYACGLSVTNFLLRPTLLKCGSEAATKLAGWAATMAHEEGLPAHERAARLRQN